MATYDPAPENWDDVDKTIVQEIIRQAELQIHHQALTAQSLDQRATTMAAFTNGGAVAILIFVASEISKGNILPASILFGAITIALFWFWSAIFAIQAFRPGNWASAGTWPHQWYSLLSKSGSGEKQLFGATIELLEESCEKNRERNNRTARLLRRAIVLAILAPIAGAILFLVGPQAWEAALTAPALAASTSSL